MTNNPKGQGNWLSRRANVVVWAGAILLWLAPMIAMQFSDEVDWTAFDFVLWAIMLGFVAGGFEIATRLSGSWAYRLGAGVALGMTFLTVWANLAVGIIGNENNPLNLMFFGVLLTGIVASVCVLFRPGGMVYAMGITAIAQIVVAVVAQAQGHNIWPFTIVAASLWAGSALLFRKAGRVEPSKSGAAENAA